MEEQTEEKIQDNIFTFLAEAEANASENNDDGTVYSSVFENESNYWESKSVSSTNSAVTGDVIYNNLLEKRKQALRAKINEDTLKYCLELIQYNANPIGNEIETRQQRLLSIKTYDNGSDDSTTVNTMVTQVISEGDSPLNYDSALKFLFERSSNAAFLIQAPETVSVRSGSRPSSATSYGSNSITTTGSSFSSQDLLTVDGQRTILSIAKMALNADDDISEHPAPINGTPPITSLNLSPPIDAINDSGQSTARTNYSSVSDITSPDTPRESPQLVLFNSLQSIGQPDTTLIRGVAVKFANGEYRLFPKTADKGSKRVTFKKREDITNSKHCYSYKPRSEEAEYAKYFLKYFFSKHYERLQRVLTNVAFVHYTSEVIQDIHKGLPLTLDDVNLTLYSYLCFFIKCNWTNDITRYDLVMMMIYFQVKSFFYDGENKTKELDSNELQKSLMGITQWECKSKNCWEKAIVDVASVLNSSPNFEKDKLIDQITYVIKKNCPHVREDRYLSRLINTILSTYFFYYVNDGNDGKEKEQEQPQPDYASVNTGATFNISELTRFSGQTALTGATRLTDQTGQTGQTKLTETSMAGQLVRAATKMAKSSNERKPASMDQDPFGILDDLTVQTFATPQNYTKGEDKDIDYLLNLLQGKTDINEAEVKINFELIKSRMNIRTFKSLKLLSTADLLRTDVIHYILDKGGDRIEDLEKTILKSFFNDIVNDVNGVPNGSKYDRLLYPQLFRKLRNAIDGRRLELDDYDYKDVFKKYWIKYTSQSIFFYVTTPSGVVSFGLRNCLYCT